MATIFELITGHDPRRLLADVGMERNRQLRRVDRELRGYVVSKGQAVDRAGRVVSMDTVRELAEERAELAALTEMAVARHVFETAINNL